MGNLTKICTKCDLEKSITEYAKKVSSPSGFQTFCKECDKERNKIWRIENPEKEKAKAKRYGLKLKKVNIESKIIEMLQPEITEITKLYLNNNDMKIEKRIISPQVANYLLTYNTNNRKPRESIVARYAKEMKEGRWKEDTGELVKISKSGVLLDGQHRLLAVVKSGCSIAFHVSFEMKDEIFEVIDQGSKRNATDIFLIEGCQYSTMIPSMIQTYCLLKNGKVGQRGTQLDNKHSPSKLLEIYNQDVESWNDVAKKSHNWYQQFSKIIQPSTIGAFYALFKDIDNVQALDFMEQLCKGTRINNDTIHWLRKKLTDDKISSFKMQTSYKNAIIIKTWNNFRKNISTSRVNYNLEKEKFPLVN
jgi:hypothetical protein